MYDHPSCCAGINSMEILGDTLWVAASEVCRVVRIDIHTETATVTYTGSEWIERILPTADGAVYISTRSGLFKSSPTDQGSTFSHFFGSQLVQSLVEVDGTIWCTDDSGTLSHLSPSGSLLWQGGVGCGVLKHEPGSDVIWGLDRSQSALVLFDTITRSIVKRVELPTTRVGAFLVDDSGDVFLSLPGRIAYSTDQGETWTQRIVGISTVSSIAAGHDQAWAGISSIGASRFIPGEERWQTVSTGIGSGIDGILIRSPTEVMFFIGYEAAVVKTTDGGMTFTMEFYDVPAAEAERSYGCRSFSEDASGRIYICANAWSWDHFQNWIWVHWSDDFGATWSSADCLYHDAAFPRWPEIALDEANQTLWVTSGAGLFSSTVGSGVWVKEEGFGYTESPVVDRDGCLHLVGEGPSGWGLYAKQGASAVWSRRELPHSGSFDTSLVIDDDGGFWYGSDAGVHYSDNGGLTWYPYTTADGLASNYVTSIAVEGSGESLVLWVGTALGVSRGTFTGQ